MPLHDKTIKRTEVTTGPLAGSRKVYSAPDGHDDLAVPFREIALQPMAAEPSFHVYDTSGPYTDPDIANRRDARAAAVARALDRGARRGGDLSGQGGRPRTTAMSARRISSAPSTSSGSLARACRQARHPARAGAGRHRHARRWSISPIARISGASAKPRRRSAPRRRRELRRGACLHSSRRNSCAAKSRAAGPSSPPISTTPNPSR